MDNPYVGVTVQMDITGFPEACSRAELPFFLCFLYCAGRAANSVPELRQRILDGQPVIFPSCDTSHTVMRPDGTYGYCRLNCMRPFSEFILTASRLHERAKLESTLDDGDDALSLIFVSTLPWLSYTALQQPTPVPADSNPRITWGKYTVKSGKTCIPVTLLANHALVDGIHISLFFENLEKEIRSLTDKIDTN